MILRLILGLVFVGAIAALGFYGIAIGTAIGWAIAECARKFVSVLVEEVEVNR